MENAGSSPMGTNYFHKRGESEQLSSLLTPQSIQNGPSQKQDFVIHKLNA